MQFDPAAALLCGISSIVNNQTNEGIMKVVLEDGSIGIVIDDDADIGDTVTIVNEYDETVSGVIADFIDEEY